MSGLELDVRRARPRLARRDALADDADVFDTRGRPRSAPGKDGRALLERRIRCDAGHRHRCSFRPRRRRLFEQSTPKTWVAVLDVIGGVFLLWYAWHLHRHPFGPEKAEGMVAQMRKVASSPGSLSSARGRRSPTPAPTSRSR